MTAYFIIDCSAEADGIEHKFSGNYYILTHIFQCLADDQLIVTYPRQVRAVNLCCVKECTAVLISIPYRFYTVFFGRYFAVSVGKSHTAHSDGRYFNIPKFPCFHNVTSFEKALDTTKHKPVCYPDDLLDRLLFAFFYPLPVNAEDRIIDEVHQHGLLVFRQCTVFL